ncbi:hypothetical protein ACFQFC_15830 [Amorphoplanes digitatis]|uniref:Transmembrane protein n=1 Tax=Actinoplanes digitatis TaxID=1868 RepID=A0A7W7MSX0_9ACTN|nr:hypothetical protein [Actinoplanes digitatis]MBB4765683.1 hypothetical protein [Actinoplanes digitatis]GID98019.1 hypothetical protein Adi01nite_74310 [Actinoplanes digitatis]
MTGTAVELRRLVGKFVLFFVGCWLIVLVAGVAGALRGASVEPLRFAILLIPGCAFVPAAYYAVGLHRSDDPGQLDRIWPKAIVYGLAGLVLLFGTAYGLYEMG